MVLVPTAKEEPGIETSEVLDSSVSLDSKATMIQVQDRSEQGDTGHGRANTFAHLVSADSGAPDPETLGDGWMENEGVDLSRHGWWRLEMQVVSMGVEGMGRVRMGVFEALKTGLPDCNVKVETHGQSLKKRLSPAIPV